MSNDFATPGDLDDFPGAPFTDALVDAAVGDVRGEAGWHIAPPRVADEVELDSTGGVWLFLPSLYVTEVTLVEDISGTAPVQITDYKVKRNGRLYRAGGWPVGVSVVRVTMTHGYADTPPELLPVLAERCQSISTNSTVAQEQAGQLSVRYRDAAAAPVPVHPTVSRYRIRGFG